MPTANGSSFTFKSTTAILGCSRTGDESLLGCTGWAGLAVTGEAESGLGEAVSLCDGDGGDVDTGETEAAYRELEYDIAGDALVDDTEASDDEHRNSEGGGGMLEDGIEGYAQRSVDPDGVLELDGLWRSRAEDRW